MGYATRSKQDLNDYAKRIHQWALDKGFWKLGVERNLGEMLMLMTSELAECLEEDRVGKPDFYVTDLNGGESVACGVYEYLDMEEESVARYKPEGVATELVDALIRILDTLGARGVDIDSILEAKMRHNETRARMHGKKY